MKKNYLFTIILLLLTFFMITSCSDESNKKTVAQDKETKSKVSVKTQKLIAKEYTDFIQVVGSIKPYQKALISTTEGGKIVNFIKDKGNYVAKGDTILIIDNEILEANLLAAKAQFELAEITYEKQKMVYEENVNSEIQYLQSKYGLKQLEANYKLIQTRYNNTFVVAPFSGYIDHKYFEEGELAPVGQPILLLIDVNRVKVEAGVPEEYVSSIKKGESATVYVKAIDKEFSGKISFVGTSINATNRTFPIEITLSNKGRVLKPELIAKVKIQNSIYDKIISIPTELISRVDDGYIVYVYENGIAQSRKIEVLRRTANNVAVASGLKEGDELIVVGYQNLIDGQAVTVVE